MRSMTGATALLLGLLAVPAQAQPMQLVADGANPSPVDIRFDGRTALFEVIGHSATGRFDSYYEVGDRLTGDALSAATHSAAVLAPWLSSLAAARVAIAYDAAAPAQVVLPGIASYTAQQWQLALKSASGETFTLTQQAPSLQVRDRGLRSSLSARVMGSGYPAASLDFTQPMALADPAPLSVRIDLQALMSAAGCCSQLHLLAPGPLPVVLKTPSVYFPAYASLLLEASRDRNLPPGSAALPTELSLDRFTLTRSIDLVVRGELGVTVDPADYPSTDAYEAARSWIAASIGVVNVETVRSFDLQALSISAVPEPATGALWVLGLACGGLALRRRCAVGAEPAAEQAAMPPARETIASSA